MKKVKKNLTIYDSTLRDGAQTRGLAFGLNDKIRIAEILDNLKVDYIEAGWPGANPTDDEFLSTQNVKFKDRSVWYDKKKWEKLSE